MEICRARVGELMAATSAGRARVEGAHAKVKEAQMKTERQLQTSKSETRAADAGHDVEVAGESESRRRAPYDPVDGLENRCRPRHCGTCGARECCNIEFECADTDAEGPDAKFQTSTVDLFLQDQGSRR